MLAVFGITTTALNLAVNLLILFLVVVWLALVYWTYADARRRIDDPMLVGCATRASLFPFVGTIVYMIVRPPEYLDDVRVRELEMQAAEARLHQLDYAAVPALRHEVEARLPALPELPAQAQGAVPLAARKPLDPPGSCARTARPRSAPRRPRRAAGAAATLRDGRARRASSRRPPR